MYLADTINEVLESRKDALIGSTTYCSICFDLTSAFALTDPYFFRYETRDYEANDFAVSGVYDMGKNVKHIIFNFSDKQKHIEITENNWVDLKFAISQACQHESIHQCQWQHRDINRYEVEPCDFKSIAPGSPVEEQSYLADADEIDAYAHDIAMEIKHYYPKKNPYDVLSNIHRRRKVWSYNYYKQTFKGHDWSQIKKRLLKKTFLWISYT